MDNPCFSILGHPSGRLINERRPYDVDMEKLILAAKERGCALELNAHPDRLDLTDINCKMAKEAGVKIAISTDAHSKTDLASCGSAWPRRDGGGLSRRTCSTSEAGRI